jgi:hypothetical protein
MYRSISQISIDLPASNGPNRTLAWAAANGSIVNLIRDNSHLIEVSA